MSFAIVGLGKMGKFYDNLLNALYVVDNFPFKNRIAFSQIEEFIAYRQPVDLVIVSTPTLTHYPIAKALLGAGYNVLVEKPVCISSRDAAELEDLASSKNLILYQSTLERYNPLIKFLKNNFTYAEVSKVESFRFGARPPSSLQDDAKFDLGIHDIDLWFYLFGRKVEWTVDVGYGSPRREIVVHLKSGKRAVFDLINKFIDVDGLTLDYSRASTNNPILEMIFDIQYRRQAMNECWSEEIKILEQSSSSRIELRPVV